MPSQLYLLFESAPGYALFECLAPGGVISDPKDYTEMARFATHMKLSAFLPFDHPEHALAGIKNISLGVLGPDLLEFLRTNLPSVSEKKSSSVQLAVQEPKIGAAISETFNITCITDSRTEDLFRGIRLHLHKFLDLDPEDIDRSQLSLAHAYSRSEVKFDVNRTDNMVKQAVFLFDQLEKDINMVAMRVKEWYGGHFPELTKIVIDNIQYCKMILLFKNKSEINDGMQAELEEITGDSGVAMEVIEAAKTSMGFDLSDIDLENILVFATRVVKLSEYRETLRGYLTSKMTSVAPNLTALLGVLVAARLVSHAGSLTALSKDAASTIQILGAEKALFRALKSRSNTPKYGLLFNSSFVQKAMAKNRGRISRVLANKCALASRIDSFADTPTSVYGEAMKEQIEDRLEFLKNGGKTLKNSDVMRTAAEKAKEYIARMASLESEKKEEEEDEDDIKVEKKKRKKEDVQESEEEEEKKEKKDKKKKDKKEKKEKKEKDKKEKKEKHKDKKDKKEKKEKKRSKKSESSDEKSD
ncbi:putative nucleolar protein Nop56 [Monocercomonoides exilis]|uniref:putative nucleolar protein Nop56 n=1 Tax=Monocercomonoides exilis TaxID=2049356 RepID=UPI00355A6173|nr:putative nucleolar protein Nop56 [Monocercomonoides exilis]|eukprot:MONOS_2193.1-p1 / transcript=MONOS_2193.1 / gene=MONOS_2193 / organism=Monocercomonoides_exilis_PA203 / gene_product=nucleolar protein Nop56 / transcript_product=nucleolar protein Nop56 / location=Mono_scaffold00043:129674-131669(+) / protein_length=528 / sequence_SO=supercontig / SO=protein_coding / is_pseudo=false